VVNFLSNRSQVVRVAVANLVSLLQFGVPQGSVHDPKRFLEYAEDICPLLKRLHYHLFVDDMQGLKHGLPTDVPQIALHSQTVPLTFSWKVVTDRDPC